MAHARLQRIVAGVATCNIVGHTAVRDQVRSWQKVAVEAIIQYNFTGGSERRVLPQGIGNRWVRVQCIDKIDARGTDISDGEESVIPELMLDIDIPLDLPRSAR